MDEIHDLVMDNPSLKLRQEALFMVFATGISAQGFEVINLNTENFEHIYLVIQDKTTLSAFDRGIHASQLTYRLWTIFESELVTIEYRTKTGISSLKATASKDICQQIKSGDRELSFLAKISRWKYSHH
ncbi:MAG: hypothetical protein IPN76_25410 [Saprospiraceae bacterium]|nr:hypothetical protein [Saprospiraceae bacterium]